jgi:hypothetical protein
MSDRRKTRKSLSRLPNLGVDANGQPLALLELCRVLKAWKVSYEQPGNPLNHAEVHGTSEDEIAAANAHAVEVLLQMMDLAEIVAKSPAVTQSEIKGKQKALDALTNIPTWERDSLFALRRSIERDQIKFTARLLGKRHRKG